MKQLWVGDGMELVVLVDVKNTFNFGSAGSSLKLPGFVVSCILFPFQLLPGL